MSQRFHPVPLVALVVLPLGVAILVSLHATSMTDWAYADWAAASAEARQSLGLAGVWAAGCSALVGSLHSSRESATCPLPAFRNGRRIVVAHFSRLATMALFGEAIGLAPLYVWCLQNSTYPSDLRILVIVGGLTVLVASVALGYWCGVLLPRMLAAPAAVAMSFAAVAAMGWEGRVWSPIWPFDVAAGTAETTTVAITRPVFFVTASALLLMSASRWLHLRSVSATALAGCALTLTPVLGVAALASSSSPDLIVRDTGAVPVCVLADSTEVCVHPARRGMLPRLVEGVRSLQSTAGPGARFPARIADSSAWITGNDVLSLSLQDEDRTAWLPTAVLDLATAVLGSYCVPGATEVDGSHQDVTDAAAIWWASQVDARVADLAVGPAAELARQLLDPTTALTADRFRRAYDDLRDCSAAASALLP